MKKDYFKLGGLISLILAIIPFTSWICGVITRFNEKKYVACIIRAVLGFNIIWILDLIFMVLNGSIFRFLDM